MRLIAVFALFILPIITFSQEREIVVSGNVIDNHKKPLSGSVIVNKTTGIWQKGNKDGYFAVSLKSSDTIQVYVVGYEIVEISFKDSIPKLGYDIIVTMPDISYELDEVNVYDIKPYQKIREEINELGVKSTDKNPDAMILSNPISFLYEKFSRIEKSNRKAALLESQYETDGVLRDLFRLFNKNKIIDLDEDEFDDFIAFLGLPYDVLQQTKDYDLALYIKKEYHRYRMEGN